MCLLPLDNFPAIKSYLKEQRHLTDAILEDANVQVYVDAKEQKWIAFPLENEGVKLRAAPDNPSPNKGRYLKKEEKPQLYYGDALRDDMKEVVICEGEIDCLVLNQLGFNAISSTSGAGTFSEAWVKRLPQGCDCVLCFDNDEAGAQGREKTRKLIREHRKDIRILDITFAKEKPKGYDVSDAYDERLKAGDTDEQFVALLRHGMKVWREPVAGGEGYVRPIAMVARPAEDVTFETWMNKLKDEFPGLAASSECCAAVIGQLLVQDTTNCFGLILVDVPSSGKTICLNFFAGCEEIIYTSDDFSPAALVSHAAQKKSNDLESIDMLPKIRFKTLLVREMAAVFGDKDDDLRKKMHLLTRVMDGEGLETESGVHGKRGYQGDYLFMLLGASTPIALRVWKVMGGAGHRLFFLSLNSKRPGVDELHGMLLDGNYKKREVAVRQMTHDFLRTLWKQFPSGIRWDTSKDDPAATMWIAKLAHFVAHYRGEILVYSAWSDGEGGGKELQHTRPQIEQPMRVMTLLYGLARGRAALEGRNSITLRDLAPVIRIALDTAPDPRPLVLRELMTPSAKDKWVDNGDKRKNLDAKTVAESMKCAVNTAKKEMEKMIVLGVAKNVKGFETVADPMLDIDAGDLDEAVNAVAAGGAGHKKEMCLADEYAWLVSDEFRNMCKEIGVELPGATA